MSDASDIWKIRINIQKIIMLFINNILQKFYKRFK